MTAGKPGGEISRALSGLCAIKIPGASAVGCGKYPRIRDSRRVYMGPRAIALDARGISPEKAKLVP
jgi:hypothetical protein